MLDNLKIGKWSTNAKVPHLRGNKLKIGKSVLEMAEQKTTFGHMGIADISWRIWNAITSTHTLMGLNMVLSWGFSGWISGLNQIVVPNSITILMDKSQLNKM